MTEEKEEKISPCSAGERIGAKIVKEPGRRGRPKLAKTKGNQKPLVLREDGRPRKRQGKGSGKPAPEIVLKGEAVVKDIRPMGRPSLYSDKLANEICERIAAGESMVKICSDEEMPGISTVWMWLDKNPEFSDRYAKAKEHQTETYVDRLMAIAEETEDVQRARLMTDSIKWLAGKLKSKKYGDRIDINKTVDVTVTGIKRVIVDDVIEGEVVTADRMITQCEDKKGG